MKRRSWIRRYWRHVLYFTGLALMFAGSIVLIVGMLVYGIDEVELLKKCLLVAILMTCAGIMIRGVTAPCCLSCLGG